MITLFEESDLVSFGNYILSEQRKQSIMQHPEITNSPTRKMFLAQATQLDMENWIRLVAKAEQEEMQRKRDEMNAAVAASEGDNMEVNLNDSITMDDETVNTIQMLAQPTDDLIKPYNEENK